MFDLFRSREKSVRILLGALLLLVALSMLTYLIPSYNTGSSTSDMIVAEIGKDDVITVPEVQTLIQNTVRGRQLPPEVLPTYLPTMVDQMVTDRAVAYEAARLGFQVTDADLADTIRQTAPGLFQDGKFVGKDAYAAMLAQQNITIEQFESDLRRQLLITRLREVAIEGTIVTPLEIEQAYRKKNEKIKIEYVKIPNDKYRSEVQPTAEEMQGFFKANNARYQTPETRNLAILIADPAKMEQSATPTDTDLQRMYSQNQDSFRTPERVKVRHILLKTEGKPASEEPKIKARAEDLLKQIRGGADFAALAKKNSEDPGSAANGGEYPGWVTRGQTVPEFEKTAFSLKAGQISDLVKTQYGYHIIQVLQHEDARLRPFEEAKGELAAQWKKQHVNDVMDQISDTAQAALQKDPAHPDKVAADLNMQLVRVDGYVAGQTVKEIGSSADFDQAVATLKKGEASQLVTLSGNKVAVALVTDVVPSRPQTFEEVQNQIRDLMVQNRLTLAVQEHAKVLVDKAKSMGGDLATAAKTMGLEVKTSGEIDRSGSVEGLGSASYIQEGFTRPDGAVFGPISTPDGTVVAKVIQHADPDLSKLPEQRVALRDEIKSQKARDRNSLFEAGLRDALIKQGKIKIHQDVINRLLASYRG
jgi:peptidyl-prolyl cis-trans isomerase D